MSLDDLKRNVKRVTDMRDDKPTKCSCVAPFYADEYGKTIEVVIERCDWCTGLEADNTRLRNQLQAANAVVDDLEIDVCDDGEILVVNNRKLETSYAAYRATQKGGAKPKPVDPGNVLLGKALFGDGRRR